MRRWRFGIFASCIAPVYVSIRFDEDLHLHVCCDNVLCYVCVHAFPVRTGVNATTLQRDSLWPCDDLTSSPSTKSLETLAACIIPLTKANLTVHIQINTIARTDVSPTLERSFTTPAN